MPSLFSSPAAHAAEPMDGSPIAPAPPATTSGTLVASAARSKDAALPQARLTNWRTIWALVKGAGTSWMEDYAASMGAALSYYTFFSLAPLLLIVVSVAGLVFGAEAARGQLMSEIAGLVGSDAARSIEGLLTAADRPAGEGIVATVLGVVAILVGATTVFGELQDALDRIWRAPARDRRGGLFALMQARVLSFGMVLGLGFLLVVSLVLSAALSALGRWWGPAFAAWEMLAQALNFALGFVLTTGTFAMIYKIMPRVSVAWRDVWIGALVTALLFSAGRLLIGLYIGKTWLASTFGAAGSLAVVLVWVYYSAQVFLLGAEFTWVYARTLGSRREIADPQAAQAVMTINPEQAVRAALVDDVSSTPRRSQPLATERSRRSPRSPRGLQGRPLGKAAPWIFVTAAAAIWLASRRHVPKSPL